MADYRIEEKAGKGSFATVYKGRHRVSLLVPYYFPSSFAKPYASVQNETLQTKQGRCGELATAAGNHDKLT